MSVSPRLKNILSPLWRQMRIDPQLLEESSSYVMEMADGVTIQFEESPADFLTLSSLIPMRAEDFTDAATLNTLLQCNLLGLAHPPVLTATLPEQQRVVVWARQSFSLLDTHEVTALFERFVGQVGTLQHFLARPSTTETA